MMKYATLTPLWIVLAAVVCASGMWLYANRVLVPYQIAQAAAHHQPRGNSSDLYPRWVGARELLLHRRDPYSIEVTREIQAGFYGRILPPDQPGRTENYQQGFYYPVYVAFGLAPTLNLPFESVRRAFFWVLAGVTVISVYLWLWLIGWRLALWEQAAVLALTLGSLPVMHGLKLQQITLLVIPLIAAAMVLFALDRQFAAGILLAVATIKPQLVFLVLLWLVIWTLADWRRRCRWAGAFLLSMVLLWAASEWYLPHWVSRFWQAIREYHSYTGEMSVTRMLVGRASVVVELAALAILTAICWRGRREPANAGCFALVVSLTLAVTCLVVPSYGPYNQILLLPALLTIIKERRTIWRKDAVNRVLLIITIGLVGWPWISSVALAGLSFVLPAEVVEKGSSLPFWTSLQAPLGVAAGILAYSLGRTFTGPQEASTS